MTSPRFLRPKSLYVAAVGIDQDGQEVVIRAKYEALDRDSELTWDDRTVDETPGPLDFGPDVKLGKPSLHNVTISFVRANVVDSVPYRD